MTQKPRKGDFRELKSKIFRGRACPHTLLEACDFNTSLGNPFVFILDPRLTCLQFVEQLRQQYL